MPWFGTNGPLITRMQLVSFYIRWKLLAESWRFSCFHPTNWLSSVICEKTFVYLMKNVVASSRTNLVHRCSWLPDKSLVLQDKAGSDQVLHLECVSDTTALRSSASRHVVEHSTCSRRSQDLHEHMNRASSDHIGPLSWQRRCCLRSSAQSHPLRSSHDSLTHVWYRQTLSLPELPPYRIPQCPSMMMKWS